MRAAPILLTLALVIGVSLTALPTTQARAFCTNAIDTWCEGVFCTYDSAAGRWDCVLPVPPGECDCVTEPCPCDCGGG